MQTVDENEKALLTELDKLEHEEAVERHRHEKLEALRKKVEDKKKVVSDLKGIKYIIYINYITIWLT